MVRWLRLRGLRPPWGLAAGRWQVHVLRVRRSYLCDGGHDLRPDANAVDSVVQRLLAVCHRQGRDLRR